MNLDQHIVDVFSTRTANGLLKVGARKVRDVVSLTAREVLMIQNLGQATLREIQARLKERGVDWPGHELRALGGRGKGAPASIKAPGWVYLMRTKSNDCTKIGFSSNPSAREATLQAEDPMLEMIYSIEESGLFETWLHQYFTRSRVRGEWFRLTPSEIEWIKCGAAIAEFRTKTI